jgi:hypothetical protein
VDLVRRTCANGEGCADPSSPVRAGKSACCKACEARAARERRAEKRSADQAHAAEPSAERLKSCLQWATNLERELVEALATHGSLVAAAEAFGMTSTRFRAQCQALERRAARQGWSEAADMVNPAPEGFRVKGVSTYYGADGAPRGQWVKTKADEEHKLELLAAAFERVADPIRGALDPADAPALLDEDLLCVYPMGDPHFGMHAWASEAGENFDLEIAQRDLLRAADHLTAIAPPAKQALVINLGDFFHADSNAATTTRGTRVDVDTRHPKVYEAGLNTMRRIIDGALRKHEHVTVFSLIGNHDEMTSMMMAIGLAALYEREPRVTVDKSPSIFHRHRFGRCLLGATHGNTIKHAELAELMACDWPEDWGETLYRHWYVGHIHSEKVIERRGCTIETFRTLAAKDAWHAAQGYRAGRDMRLDVWHREHGLVNRSIVGVQQLRGKLR